MKPVALALVLLALLTSCDDRPRSRGARGEGDGGDAVATREDATTAGGDAEATDAEPGAEDGGQRDADAIFDADTTFDASAILDGGPLDVGPFFDAMPAQDAGAVDAAPFFDAMPARDAAGPDAQPDAGSALDAESMSSDAGAQDGGGRPDASSDAGATDGGATSDAGGSDAGLVPVCDTAWWWYFDRSATIVQVTGTMSLPPWHDQNPPLLSYGEGLFGAPADRFAAGQHRYKLIVDQSPIWHTDPWNPLRESDGAGGQNNLVGRWHSFVFRAPAGATEIRVAGSFTSPPWDVGLAPALSAVAPGSAWRRVSLELPAGRHSYKFISRSGAGAWSWQEDPLNPEHELDGVGGFNSVLHVCTQ